jgi:hypothetical protein
MHVGLLGGALAVALVALGAWLAASGGVAEGAPGGRGWTRALLLGLGGALLLFLLTLPTRAPFQPGGQLGIGALVGAAFAALLAWGAGRPGEGASPLRLAGVLGAALAPVALLCLLYRGSPVYALIGALLGQAATLFFLEAAWGSDVAQPRNADLQLFLGVSAALAAGVALAIAQYALIPAAARTAAGGRAWWALPVLVLGALLVGALVAALAARGTTARVIVAAGIAGGLLALFAVRFPLYWPLWLPPAAGFVTGALVLFLAYEVPGSATEAANVEPGAGNRERGPLVSALLGPVLLIALLIVAYRLRTGLGIALAALGYAGALAVLPGSMAARRGLQLLALAALFRLSYAALDLEATSVYLTAHYALIGMLGGALLPVAFGLLAAPSSEAERGSGGGVDEAYPAALWPLALAVVTIPAGLLLLWGLRAVAGLLLGLVVGQGFLMLVLFLEADGPLPGDRSESATARAARAAPFAAVLLLAVAAIQLLPPLAPLVQDLTRGSRAVALLVVAAVMAAAFVPLRTRNRM